MNINDLVEDIISNRISMVYRENFDTLLKHQDVIDQLEGDIIECGCWRGGFSIFLSKLFPNKKIWVLDSFEGFQNTNDAHYEYSGLERHTPSFTHNMVGQIAVPYEDVVNNFFKYGMKEDIESDRISVIKGFVRDTANKISVEKISILRIDVDSYSAVLEVLNALYEKVVSGGFIIFDDSGLRETFDAMKTFFAEKNLPLSVYHPTDNMQLIMGSRYSEDETGLPPGCFIIKN